MREFKKPNMNAAPRASLVSRIRTASAIIALLALGAFTLAGTTTYSIASKREDLTGRSLELLVILDRTGAIFPQLASKVTTPFDPSTQTSDDWLSEVERLNAQLEANLDDLREAATEARIDISDERIDRLTAQLVDIRDPITTYEAIYIAARDGHAAATQQIGDARIALQQSYRAVEENIQSSEVISAANYLTGIGLVSAIDLTDSIQSHLDDLLSARTFEESDAATDLIRLQLRDLTLLLGRLSAAEGRIEAARNLRDLRRSLFEVPERPALVALGAAREALNDRQNAVFAQFERLREETTRITEEQQRYIDETGKALARQTRLFFIVLAASSAAVLLVGGILWRQVIVRQLSRRLETLMSAHDRLNAGDLSPIHLDGENDELTELAEALETNRLQLIERERLEGELRQRTEEAIESAAAKTQFLSTMSHEVRTPLNAIMGLFELIETSDAPERQRLRAHNGRIAAQGLFDVLTQIVDAGKLEANMMTVEPGPLITVDLKRHLQATLEGAVANSGKVGRVATKLTWGTGIPKRISVDGMRLRQILNNLVDNAVRFTDEGRVSVSVAYSANSEDLSITVTDTGIGIADEDLGAIFDIFRQVDSGPKRRAGGSGLGLAISRSLAELMEGSLTVRSRVNEGSEFELCIPAKTV